MSLTLLLVGKHEVFEPGIITEHCAANLATLEY